MKNLLIIITFFITSTGFAQEFIAQQEDTVYSKVEQMPEFKGGERKMFKFIEKNAQRPAEALNQTKPGTSHITFVVEKDGALTGISVLKGAPECPKCDEEVMRVIALMPKWNPGKQDGKLVRVQFTFSMKFSG